MKTNAAILLWLMILASLSACSPNRMPANDSASVETIQEVPPGEGVYCPAVEQRVMPEDCEDLTRADAEVSPGAAAFNVPDPMRRGETFEVHLIIDRRSSYVIRALDAASGIDGGPTDANMTNGHDSNMTGDGPDSNSAEAGDRPPVENTNGPAGDEPPPTPGQIVEQLQGTPEIFYPPVGRHMRAELVGQGFDIVAKSEASQQIPLGGQATWIWDVKAREGGAQSLTLITVVEGVANGRRFVLARTPRVRTVTVEVSLRDQIWDVISAAPNWIKAVTAVVVALGGLLTAWYGLPWRKRRGGQGGAS